MPKLWLGRASFFALAAGSLVNVTVTVSSDAARIFFRQAEGSSFAFTCFSMMVDMVNLRVCIRGQQNRTRRVHHDKVYAISIRGFDAASRITGFNDGASTQSFGYDALSRLTSFTGLSLNQTYQYDLVGNRLSLTQGPNTTGYALSPTATQGASTRSLGYDPAGNRAMDGSTVYTTNARGHLASVKVGTVTTTYTLNGLSQRVKKAGYWAITTVRTGPSRRPFTWAMSPWRCSAATGLWWTIPPRRLSPSPASSTSTRTT